MDKIHKPPQLDEALKNKLHQLTKEFGIAQIFYHPATSTAIAQIIIVTFENKYVEIIESRKWIRNSIENNGVIFHVISLHKMEFTYKKGNPFTAYYCHQNNLIYQNSETSPSISADWDLFKKKYNSYKEQFYHDHDILLSESNRFDSYYADIATVLLLKSVYEHDVECLESLYLGKTYTNENLHQRIKRLSEILPMIGSLFVEENDQEYYLIREFDKAIEDAKQDELYYNDKMLDAIREIEIKLYNLVSNRFSELKQLIKSGARENNELIINPRQEESELAKIISEIVRIKPVEEIYFFDKKENPEGSLYYLLLIGNGLGTTVLNQIQESIFSKLEMCNVVLIGHPRIWIQKEHFIHQEFFQKIMIPENRVHQSHEFYPLPHWESSFVSEFQDLSYYFRSAKRLADNYFIMRQNLENENTEGLNEWFSKIILRIFRTFIFSKSAYLPHYLSAFSLWKLCLHFEPKMEKIEFLFEKLGRDNFYENIDYQSRYHHNRSRITERDLTIMDEILLVLMNELTEVVKMIDKDCVEPIKIENS